MAVASATAARLDALQVRITGNVSERRSSELLNHHRVEGGTLACMKAAGRAYEPVPFVSFYEGFTDADLGYGTGHATVIDSVNEGGRRFVLNEMSYARLARAGALDPDLRAASPADVAALNRCRAAYGHRAYLDVEPPPGAYALAAYSDLLAPIYADPRVRAAMEPYRSCMKQRYGHDVDDRSDFLFKPRFSRADALIDGAPPNARWTLGVAEMRTVFAADVDCRLPAYLIEMDLLATRLDAWESGHRTELDTIRAAWRQRVVDAALLPPR